MMSYCKSGGDSGERGDTVATPIDAVPQCTAEGSRPFLTTSVKYVHC